MTVAVPSHARWGLAGARPMHAAPLVAAGLCTMAFPPFDAGVLAWIALAPLVYACVPLSTSSAFAQGFAFGLVTTLGIFRWMFEVPAFGWLQAAPLAAYLALYPALWCGALPRLARSRVPLPLSAAALWTVLDWIRSHAAFLALPWATLAHSQHENLAILQMAAVAGEGGITFLVVAANVAWAQAWRGQWRAPVLVGVLVGLVHAAGGLVLHQGPSGPALAVAVVQPNAAQDPLPALTEDAARQGAALVVWPEGALRDLRDLREAAVLAQRTGLSLIAGATEAQKVVVAPATEPVPRAEAERYNSAWLVQPGEPTAAPYRKQRLVPFAEWVPPLVMGSWPGWLVGSIDAISAGPAFPPPLLARVADVGVLICWEGLFADLARASVRQGARLLAQPTNDAWFGRSAAASQHNLASVLRAVELGTPVAVASNTGPSQIVDAQGRVVARIDAFRSGVAVAPVNLRSGHTTYATWGDGWLLAALALACAALVAAVPHQGGIS